MLTHEEKDQQWKLVMDGLNRAVEWIRQHRELVTATGFLVGPDQKTGIEIFLSYCWQNDGRQELIEQEFSGKPAYRQEDRDGDISYRVESDDLAFTWSVLRHKVAHDPTETVVTL